MERRRAAALSGAPALPLASGLALAVAALAFGALMVGPSPFAPGEVLAALAGRAEGPAGIVVLNVRLPRVAAALLVGAALGVGARPLRLLVIVAATLMTAAVTALAGVVGWVGLVTPHVARMLTGPGFGRLLPVAALLGAAHLLAVDTLARKVAPTEVPLGILTAMIGAPFFVWRLARGRRGWS